MTKLIIFDLDGVLVETKQINYEGLFMHNHWQKYGR
jgi:beta-phosphoglucomutase-like phosphatase (HAD superfamily)